jgi:hypothetical protein
MMEYDYEVENKFPFGVPGEEASVGISYATAEGEIAGEMTEERRKSMIFGDRETKKGKKGKGKDSPPTAIRGILKCTHSLSLRC